MNVCTASCRWRIGSTAASGCESQWRKQPRAHRRDGSVERAVKRGVARGVVMLRFENFQMPQRRVIEREKIAALIKRNAREMLHVAAQILREIMQRAARRADGGGFVLQPEAVERRDLEMFAHREERGFRRERPVVVAAQNLECAAQQIAQRQPLRVGKIISAGRNRSSSVSSAASSSSSVVRKSPVVKSTSARPKIFPRRINGGQKIIPFRDEHPFVEMRAGRKDLRDLAFDKLAGARILDLIADGDLASGLEDAARCSRWRRDAAGRTSARRCAR